MTTSKRPQRLSTDLGFYFSTIEVETECDQEDPAAAIDFANTDHLGHAAPHPARGTARHRTHPRLTPARGLRVGPG